MGIRGIEQNQYAADMWVKKATSKASSNQFAQQMNNMSGAAPKGYKVYMKTDDMLYSGGNGSGLSFYIKYAESTTEEDPTVVAKGVDENGKEFEQIIHINDINPRHATVVQMHALEAYLGVDKNGGLSSLPHAPSFGNMGLYDRADFIEMFRNSILDMKTLGEGKLAAYYQRSMKMYREFMMEKGKSGTASTDINAPFGYWKKNLRKVQGKTPEERTSNSDTEIITKPDGTKILMVTTQIGATETVMSVKLSDPSDFADDYVKAAKAETQKNMETVRGEESPYEKYESENHSTS